MPRGTTRTRSRMGTRSCCLYSMIFRFVTLLKWLLQCLHYRLQLATAGAKEKVCGLRPRVSPSEALACSSSTSGPYPTLTFGPLVSIILFAVSIVSSSSSSWFYVVNVHSSWDKGICCFKCSIECNLKCAHYCSILTSSSTENKLEFKVHHREFELKT